MSGVAHTFEGIETTGGAYFLATVGVGAHGGVDGAACERTVELVEGVGLHHMAD